MTHPLRVMSSSEKPTFWASAAEGKRLKTFIGKGVSEKKN
jgi:hypothetical protein